MSTAKHSQTHDELQPTADLDQGTSTSVPATAYDSFAGFWRQCRRALPLGSSSHQGTVDVLATMQSGILGVLAGVGWRNREKERFSKQVAGFVDSDAFIDEASAAIGLPKEDETEDEYVERGKAVFRRLLRTSLMDT